MRWQEALKMRERTMIHERNNLHPRAGATSRRQLIASAAIVFGSMATASQVWSKPQQPAMKEAPSTAANQARTSLHQEIELKATPQRVYEILLDPKQFAAFTGMPAEIDPKPGGALSMFGGMIVGRNVELISNQRIVQAWRSAGWDPGVYSVVRFELKADGPGTILVLDHSGFPKGAFDHLDPGWYMRYWDPLKKYLGQTK
jgi:activator of HSP90 ATPase